MPQEQQDTIDWAGEATGLVAAVGTVPMTGATSESIMADDFLDTETKMVLAAR